MSLFALKGTEARRVEWLKRVSVNYQCPEFSRMRERGILRDSSPSTLDMGHQFPSDTETQQSEDKGGEPELELGSGLVLR